MATTGKAIRALIIFGIGFLLWWNKFAIYQFINGDMSPPLVEWKEYIINVDDSYLLIRNTDKSLRMINKKSLRRLICSSTIQNQHL